MVAPPRLKISGAGDWAEQRGVARSRAAESEMLFIRNSRIKRDYFVAHKSKSLQWHFPSVLQGQMRVGKGNSVERTSAPHPESGFAEVVHPMFTMELNL